MMAAVIICRRKRNGSMRAEQAAQEIMLETLMKWVGTKSTQIARFILLGRRNQMPGACTISVLAKVF